MDSGITCFKEEAIDIHKYYPELTYFESTEGIPYISGELKLNDDHGLYIDSYFIRIVPKQTYPYQFPYVFETGRRIPVNIDWHLFSDGHCCFKSIPEETLLCKQGITLLWFIEQQVKPYFYNQKYREMHGYFLHERSHGMEGNLEFFKDVFKTNDLTKIAQGLMFIKGRKEPDRVSNCFCGSGIKYRKCHRETFRSLSKFTDEELDLYTNWIIDSPGFKI